MTVRGDLFRQAKALDAKTTSAMSNDDIQTAIDDTLAVAPETMPAQDAISISDLAGSLITTLKSRLPGKKRLDRTGNYQDLIRDRLKLIKGQLLGHSITKSTRRALHSELDAIKNNTWDRNKLYRDPNIRSSRTGEQLIPDKAGQMHG